MSEPEHDHPFWAVSPGLIVTVLAPVVPVHLNEPAQLPPTCVLIEAHAPVPDRVGAEPPAIMLPKNFVPEGDILATLSAAIDEELTVWLELPVLGMT
jgi:hypothetical protein